MSEQTVILETSLGNIKLALDAERAPKTVANFSRYLDAGHYDGTIFHRVIEGFMIQGGGYDTSYERKPTGEPVENEAHNGLRNVRGSVAMARTGEPHSATAQFFINVADNASLDHRGQSGSDWGYTVFGTVVEGMDVVDRIRSVPTGAQGSFAKDAPLEQVVIRAARRG
jgi:peptidyl-prolyl cis-trans isomerase B (cyclophilin B)